MYLLYLYIYIYILSGFKTRRVVGTPTEFLCVVIYIHAYNIYLYVYMNTYIDVFTLSISTYSLALKRGESWVPQQKSCALSYK